MKFFIIFTIFLSLYANPLKTIDVVVTKNTSNFNYNIKLRELEHLKLDVLIDEAYQKTSQEYNATDIVLLVDNTASMTNLIALIKSQINNISSFIFNRYPNSQIAIATISDHVDSKNADAYKIIQTFTNNSLSIEQRIKSLKVDDINNTDYEEAYLYGLSESLMLKWRRESQKILFFIGDAWGHNPDAGKDKQLGTKDDLFLNNVLDRYNEEEIKICSYYKDEYDETKEYFKELSNSTYGFSKAIKKSENLQNDFRNILQDVTSVHYTINTPFEKEVLVTKINNHFQFQFDLNPSMLQESQTIEINFINNDNMIGHITIHLVFGKPWGIIILIALISFCLTFFIALKYIYKNIYTTTILDFAYLRHYGVLIFALVLYVSFIYIVWIVINQPNFPIIWSKLWW